MLIRAYVFSKNQVLKMVCIGNIGISPYGNAHAKRFVALNLCKNSMVNELSLIRKSHNDQESGDCPASIHTSLRIYQYSLLWYPVVIIRNMEFPYLLCATFSLCRTNSIEATTSYMYSLYCSHSCDISRKKTTVHRDILYTAARRYDSSRALNYDETVQGELARWIS